MASKPLLILDFDGVIVDGINEYWWSARKACIELLDNRFNSLSIPQSLPQAFLYLRPWVHHGWEMVLIATELIRPDSPLNLLGAKAFSKNYDFYCHQALKAWDWTPTQLQTALDKVRHQAITDDLSNWLALHKPFSHVVKRLQALKAEKIDFAVLTTKGTAFTAELLNASKLEPNLLYGHEAGSKTDLIIEIIKDRQVLGFVEDRLSTLKNTLRTEELASMPCYLASWGYLKPEDKEQLPPGIHLLTPQTLATPLASWP